MARRRARAVQRRSGLAMAILALVLSSACGVDRATDTSAASERSGAGRTSTPLPQVTAQTMAQDKSEADADAGHCRRILTASATDDVTALARDRNCLDDRDGKLARRAMFTSACYGSARATGFLLRLGVSPDVGNADGVKPAFLVVSSLEDDFRPDHPARRLRTLKTLRRGGVDLFARDLGGLSLMHACAGGSYVGICEYLLAKGLNLEARDEAGETPLMSAARSGSAPSVRFLLARGADRSAVNAAGESARQLAERNGLPQTATALL